MLNRAADPQTVALTDSASTTPAIEFSFAGGTIFVPTGSPITTLTFHAAEKLDGTFLAAYDRLNNAVTMTVAAARCYPIPEELFGCAALKIVANAAGSVLITRKR